MGFLSRELATQWGEGHCLSVREKNKQSAPRIYLNGHLVENGLVDTTNSSATSEQSEILE